MKNYFLYITIILFFSANFSNTLFAQKKNEKYEALNAYFETIIKDTTQTVYVAKEKINSNETLKIFGLNDIMIIDRFGNGKGDDTLYNKNDYEKMKRKYENSCTPGERIWWCSDDFWENTDFRCKKVTLESINTIKKQEALFQKHDSICVFSELLYYQNKKYLVFTVDKLYLSGSSTRVIIMKKIKGKWTVTHKGENPNEIN